MLILGVIKSVSIGEISNFCPKVVKGTAFCINYVIFLPNLRITCSKAKVIFASIRRNLSMNCRCIWHLTKIWNIISPYFSGAYCVTGFVNGIAKSSTRSGRSLGEAMIKTNCIFVKSHNCKKLNFKRN